MKINPQNRTLYSIPGKFKNSNETRKTTPGLSPDKYIKQDSKESQIKTSLINLMREKQKVLPGDKTRQYADSWGRVTHMALMLSDYVYGDARKQVLNAYKTLFKEMEPDTRFTVVVESDKDQQDVEKIIKENNVPNPERIKFIKPKTGGLTVWARDMMVGMYLPEDEERSALLEQTPLHNWHGSDSQVPSYIAENDPNILLDEEPRIVTDGGDVMSNRKGSFVGYYSVAATARNLAAVVRGNPRLKREVIRFYENRFNKEVVEVMGDNEKLFPFTFLPRKYPRSIHRYNFEMVKNPKYSPPKVKKGQVGEGEMYEDLAVELFKKQFGKDVTVMGRDDPQTPHVEQPATDHMDMGLTPVDEKTFFLGDPNLLERIFRSMSPEKLDAAKKRLSKMAGRPIHLESFLKQSRNNDNPADFDAYEKTLTQQGYNVVRLPHSEPDWFGPYISYNNCLMERFEKDGQEIKRVFLPVYGIEDLDNYAVKAYQDQGFEVHRIPMDALSRRWGALRCITNWLERSPRG